MISFLEGKIVIKRDKFVVLNVQGVGYKVFLSKKSIFKLPDKNLALKVFCYLHVRENALELYGFLSEEELEFFESLNDIQGIGPKIALEIASLGPLEKLKKQIEAQDEKVFVGIPGLGRKKTMTIILALSGKIKDINKIAQKGADEAEDALASLGFSRQRAREALEKVSKNNNTEQRIKEALKILGRD